MGGRRWRCTACCPGGDPDRDQGSSLFHRRRNQMNTVPTTPTPRRTRSSGCSQFPVGQVPRSQRPCCNEYRNTAGTTSSAKPTQSLTTDRQYIRSASLSDRDRPCQKAERNATSTTTYLAGLPLVTRPDERSKSGDAHPQRAPLRRLPHRARRGGEAAKTRDRGSEPRVKEHACQLWPCEQRRASRSTKPGRRSGHRPSRRARSTAEARRRRCRDGYYPAPRTP